ncbi:MAG: hypothetical protein LM576_06900 [Thermofilum sp.]|nr:hypothetical protein [Thermofilum sp.]
MSRELEVVYKPDVFVIRARNGNVRVWSISASGCREGMRFSATSPGLWKGVPQR